MAADMQVLVAIGLILASLYATHFMKKRERKKRLRAKWDSVEKDVVVLHQFPRSYVCPSPSPFPLKLETFLRIAGIKYVVDFEQSSGPEGLCPWITINGEDVGDSQLALEFLSAKFDVKLTAGMEASVVAAGRAFRVMLEERLRWCLGMDKWLHHGREHAHDWFAIPGVPIRFIRSLIFLAISRKVRKSCKAAGIGLHTREEVEALGLGDLSAAEQFLGKKPYLLGEKPTEADCALFGLVCSAMHCTHPDSVYRKKLLSQLPGLQGHYKRMRDEFWPDWDRVIAVKPF